MQLTLIQSLTRGKVRVEKQHTLGPAKQRPATYPSVSAMQKGQFNMEPTELEIDFHEAMLNIYRVAKSEARYNAQRFLQMVVDHGGVVAARMLISADTVSEGYTALWERRRLDLTVEAMVVNTPRFNSLFTEDELQICRNRLQEYEYQA